MEETLDEHPVLTVPIQEHKRLFPKFEECTEDGWAMLDEIKHLKALSDDQQRQIRELTARHEEMLCDQAICLLPSKGRRQ